MVSVLIMLPFSFTVHGELLAITDNAIQGSAPYLTFDEGKTKATDTSGLLGIKLSNETTITKDSDVSTGTDPIELPGDNDTFASVMTLVPLFADNATYPTIKLTELIKDKKYWGDDNGDENPSVTPAAAGLTVAWFSNSTTTTNGTDITAAVKSDPNKALNACDAPYRLTITSTAGTLSTQYGDPKSSVFAASNHSYFIKPKPPVTPYACYAQPNLDIGNYPYGGSAIQWNGTKGFKPQDIDVPSSNFPTVGSNKLFFNLTVGGNIGSLVTFTKSPIDSLVDLTLDVTGNLVKVTLIGPTKDGGGAFTPTTFEIYSDSTKIYSFELTKWFITRNLKGEQATGNNFCKSLNGIYHLPLRKDLTNTTAYAIPASHYTRTIGGGLFAEWGKTINSYYVGTEWVDNIYWTSEWKDHPYVVDSKDGSINSQNYLSPWARTACVMP